MVFSSDWDSVEVGSMGRGVLKLESWECDCKNGSCCEIFADELKYEFFSGIEEIHGNGGGLLL